MIDLAKRAVACKGWRWMPGMLARCGGRKMRSKRSGRSPYRGALPDLADPATLGCLLALVREAWGDKGIHTECTLEEDGQGGWVRDWVIISSFPLLWTINEPPYDTEAAAFVAALEAAP